MKKYKVVNQFNLHDLYCVNERVFKELMKEASKNRLIDNRFSDIDDVMRYKSLKQNIDSLCYHGLVEEVDLGLSHGMKVIDKDNKNIYMVVQFASNQNTLVSLSTTHKDNRLSDVVFENGIDLKELNKIYSRTTMKREFIMYNNNVEV